MEEILAMLGNIDIKTIISSLFAELANIDVKAIVASLPGLMEDISAFDPDTIYTFIADFITGLLNTIISSL